MSASSPSARLPTSTTRVSPRRLGMVIVAEFDEMPGTRLTMPQVCRLWGLSRPDADAIIAALVERRVLAIDADGRVCRVRDLSG